MIPSTLPVRSINGPPLLPGLTAASVWTSVAVGVWRMPLTMPRVSVFWNKPSADPIANTSCPMRASAVAPIVNVGCFGSAGEIFNTATSTSVAVRSTRAGTTSLEARRIVTELLPLTTCTFVSRVSGVMKNPLPRLAPASTSTIAGMTCATTLSNPDGSGAATEGAGVEGLLFGAYSAVGRPPSITVAGAVGDADAGTGNGAAAIGPTGLSTAIGGVATVTGASTGGVVPRQNAPNAMPAAVATATNPNHSRVLRLPFGLPATSGVGVAATALRSAPHRQRSTVWGTRRAHDGQVRRKSRHICFFGTTAPIV